MSKELEALEIIKKASTKSSGWMDDPIEYVYYLEIKTLEKSLKALEIIKKKEVNVFIFLHSGDLETYNDMVEDNQKLAQEEYNLLRKVLL